MSFAPRTATAVRNTLLTASRFRTLVSPAFTTTTSPYQRLFTPRFFTTTAKMSEGKQGVHNLEK